MEKNSETASGNTNVTTLMEENWQYRQNYMCKIKEKLFTEPVIVTTKY